MKFTEEKIIQYSILGLLSITGLILIFRKSDNSNIEDPTGNGTNYGLLDPQTIDKIVNNLLQYMDQFGTKEEEIFSELTSVTQSQFKQIYDAFGLKSYSDILGQSAFFGTDRDLAYWLKAELGVTSEYYQTLKLKYPNYL